MSDTPASARLPARTKTAFGVGAIAEGAIAIAFASFAILFYRNQLGLSGTLAGAAVMIALVFDAVSDPVIGSISDRWQSRWGRRHPFLFLAPLPLAASFTAVFMPPPGLGEWGLFAWLTVFAILLRTSLTFYHVPHLALGAELTPDYIERTRVMSHNAIYQLVGGASTFFLGWTWIGASDEGIASRSVFGSLGAAVAIVSALAIFVSAWFTRDRIPHLLQPAQTAEPAGLAALVKAVGECLGNRNYRMLLLGLVFIGAAAGLRENLGSFMNLFFWELEEEQIRWFAFASPPSYILAFLFVARLHGRFDKRETLIGAVSMIVVAGFVPIALRLAGAFPENGSPWIFPLLMLAVFVSYTGTATLTITVMSALADVADQHELDTGNRQEGIFYSARTFFGKLTTALGLGLAGVGLDLIGFETNSVPGEVPAETLFGLGILDGILPTIPATIAVFFYGAYRIDQERHAEIRRELDARAAAAAAPTGDPASAP